jgi:hypothetical protein
VLKGEHIGVIMAFNTLFQHLVRGTEENHETCEMSKLGTEIQKVKKQEYEIIRLSYFVLDKKRKNSSTL